MEEYQFKVGDRVQVRPGRLGLVCRFGGTYHQGVWKKEYYTITKVVQNGIAGNTIRVDNKVDNPLGWLGAASDFYLVEGVDAAPVENKPQAKNQYNFKSNVMDILFDIQAGHYINIHRDACKGVLKEDCIYKIRDVDYVKEVFVISYARKIKFTDAYCVDFNPKFEDDEQAKIPSNLGVIRKDYFGDHQIGEIVDPNKFSSRARQYMIPVWYTVPEAAIVLDEKYYKGKFAKFWEKEVKEIFDLEFVKGIDKKSWLSKANGEEVVVSFAGGKFGFKGV